MAAMNKVASFLQKVVPWIGAAATGNIPALVALAAKTVSGCVGKEVSPDAESIADAVAGATPDQIAALKQADNDFAAKMQQMNFQHIEDLQKMAYDDTANARARQMTLRDRIPAILSIGITVGFFGLLSVMMSHVLPSGNDKIIDIMIGALGTAWVQVISYYFGSSAAHDTLVTSMGGEKS